MRTEDLNYELPEDAIAQTPAVPRDSARLLIDLGVGREPQDAHVADLAEVLRADDLLVLNETRVLPARVAATRSSGGAAEVLLLQPLQEEEEGWWEALCRPSRKLRPGDMLASTQGSLLFEVGQDLGEGRRKVFPHHQGELLTALELAGEAPLPPYIRERLSDQERYQTVFSKRAASAAAPTAGLHLTPELLDRVAAQGVQIETVELVVGLDTFRPVTTDLLEDHQIHSEWYQVPERTRDAVQVARVQGRRVVAVGTTTVRALESAALSEQLQGRTELFITPGFEFAVVDVMMTNFHLPRSSLLAMIQAFIGCRWQDLYRTALQRKYRFLSFGDAMLLESEQT
ncbi:MAG: tRNA preQ1(34) S-adenosylmethionine ribosyltransferase-isomerase QueA [Microthrixaceae bacterium]